MSSGQVVKISKFLLKRRQSCALVALICVLLLTSTVLPVRVAAGNDTGIAPCTIEELYVDRHTWAWGEFWENGELVEKDDNKKVRNVYGADFTGTTFDSDSTVSGGSMIVHSHLSGQLTASYVREELLIDGNVDAAVNMMGSLGKAQWPQLYSEQVRGHSSFGYRATIRAETDVVIYVEDEVTERWYYETMEAKKSSAQYVLSAGETRVINLLTGTHWSRPDEPPQVVNWTSGDDVWNDTPYADPMPVPVNLDTRWTGQLKLRCKPVSNLELIDPWPDLVTGDGKIVGDHQLLAKSSNRVTGAAADGVTKVLLKYHAPESGPVQFCLDTAKVDQDGGLAQLGGIGRSQCISTETVNVGGDYAFAIYTVPDDFNRGGDEDKKEREVTLKATFKTGMPDSKQETATLTIVRPPVVLIHGLWSEGGTWKLPLQKDTNSRWDITVEDYKYTNSKDFNYNARVPIAGIVRALRGYREQGIAVTQVDVIGHSMGGLLSRIHDDRFSKHRRNYFQGDINRLITLNTPHGGSQFGNMLQTITADDDLCRATFETLGDIAQNAIGMGGINQGAIRDLAVGSDAIKEIQATDVPAHAFAGLGGSEIIKALQDVLDESDPGTIAINALVDMLRELVSPLDYTLSGLEQSLAFVGFCANREVNSDFFNSLFHNDGHDLIVSQKSQEGGMPSSAISTSPSFSSIHIGVTGVDSPYNAQLIHLLNTSVEDIRFASFPAPNTLDIPVLSARTASDSTPVKILNSGLTISEPAKGATVQTGETVTVKVAPSADVSVGRVLLMGSDVVALDSTAPFDFQLLIPKTSLGTLSLVALGTDGSTLAQSQVVSLTVTTPSNLESIQVQPNDMYLFSSGDTGSIYVSGQFDDGFERRMSGADTGTFYTSTDETIAKVSADGVVTAMAQGDAGIIVNSGGFTETVYVTVSSVNEEPLAYAGQDQTVSLGDTVSLDGSGSLDLDDDYGTLKFEWTQIQGPAVTLNDTTTDQPSFALDVPGMYEFGLVVRDEATASQQDTVRVKTVGFTQNENNLYLPSVLR